MPPKQQYKSNRNVAYSCKYHVVFCPKYRRKELDDDIAARLKESIHEVAAQTACEVIELEVKPEHVHLLCDVDPQFGIARFVRLVKGRSSHALRCEFPKLKRRLPTLWTNRWFCSTVGSAPLAIVKQYIANQKNR